MQTMVTTYTLEFFLYLTSSDNDRSSDSVLHVFDTWVESFHGEDFGPPRLARVALSLLKAYIKHIVSV